MIRVRHLIGWTVAMSLVVGASGAAQREVPQPTTKFDGRKHPLIEAVKQRNVEHLKALLGIGANVNAPEPDGTTALHWAAHQGELTILNLLLDAGANGTASNRYGMTPLLLACENGKPDVIERLLKAGVEPNNTPPDAQTPLMTAARTGSADAIEVLLSHGADVNAKESLRGQTALMWAAAGGHAAAVEVLIRDGANVHALSHGPATTIAGLSLYARPNRATRLDAFTPLLFAVQAGHIGTSRTLIEYGADVNDTTTDGTSALVLAIANGHYELAGFLLDEGADPNAAKQGWAALVQVIRTKNPSVGQAPPLIPTGQMSPARLAEKLITHGAEIDARITQQIRDRYRTHLDMVGATAYIMAAKAADAEMMRLLLAAGADPFARTQTGRTALMVAAGIDMWYVDEDSGTNEDAVEAVKVALQAGSDINAVNDDGGTALHGAAFRGVNEIVQLFVDRGARLDVRNKEGFTPLMVANGDQRISCNLQRRPETVELFVKLLTERGLPARVRDPDEKYGGGSRGYTNLQTPPKCNQ